MPRKKSTDHILVAVAMETDASKKAAQGRRMPVLTPSGQDEEPLVVSL